MMPILVLHLGGRFDRVLATGRLARRLGMFDHVLFATEADPARVVATMNTFGVDRSMYTLDYRAWDTVTSFTELWSTIKEYNPRNIIVVTDQYHMRRASLVAQAALAFRGIKLITCTVHTHDTDTQEKLWRALRDCAMALLWRFTGINLASRGLKQQRSAQIKAWALEAEAL